jgi:hypothetical protein
MDEDTRQRLEELHRQLENVLRLDPKGFVGGEMSFRQEELHKIGFEKMRINLDGCYWELLRVPV